MNENKKCVPKQSQGRFFSFILMSIGLTMVIIILGVIYGALIYNLLIGTHVNINLISVSILILGTCFFLFCGFATLTIMRQTWIEIYEDKLRVSRFIRWTVIPYNEITLYKKLLDNGLEIVHAGAEIHLYPYELEGCYDVLLSRLQEHVQPSSISDIPNENTLSIKSQE